MVGASATTRGARFSETTKALRPDVLLVGVKTLHPDTVDRLERIRRTLPELAVILMFTWCDWRGIKRLRDFAANPVAGCAYLHRYSIDRLDQLAQIVQETVEGRVVVDPALMEVLIVKPREDFMKGLTPRELEILSQIVIGYRKKTKAEMLSSAVNTVGRHVQGILSKHPADGHAES